MSAKKIVPSYLKHKSSGRGYAVFGGRQLYFPGPHGSPESTDAYHAELREREARGRLPALKVEQVKVANLADAFWQLAGHEHSASNLANYHLALRPLLKLYDALPVAEFTPTRLEAVRLEMIGLGWARPTVNKMVRLVRAVFDWGVSKEMVPNATADALKKLRGLRTGKSAAPETSPVRPVAPAMVDAILPHVSPTIRG